MRKENEIKAINDDFKWDRLLSRIKRKKVIPVIGQGLYRVDDASKNKRNVPLYHYLADCISKKCRTTITSGENHKFAKACFDFLNNDFGEHPDLSEFLQKKIKEVQLKSSNSFSKLARIKNFNVFINTAYDNFLSDIIESIRFAPIETLCYAKNEKYLNKLDNKLFTSIENNNSALVYHIFGNLENSEPAYTEGDIIESIIDLNIDMVENRQNNLFQKLESSTLLFIGCGYDDWLYRFFIRAVANKPYEFYKKAKTISYIGDDFSKKIKDPFRELGLFLKNYKMELFHAFEGGHFIDLLFDKIEKDDPEEIIQPIIFISFEGSDRPAAQQLSENLKKDGFNVWLDESEFKGGDNVDDKIKKTIDKCHAFIPLISRNSEKVQTKEGKLKYHIQEWEQAFNKSILKKKQINIIPVIIDDMDCKVLKYDKFKSLFHLNIPGGRKIGDYEKLKNRLVVIQRENED
ncbi:MAG: toll/interleukin-1 receptor domain-containing protein [Candidatus Aminicenantes bacterium]|nr:toll/interleukin-1 receptor domain-containing protein [Candidatus Aminicenantes bacterium]